MRKVSAKKVVTVKPPIVRPSVFKLNSWNPDIQIVEENDELDSKQATLFSECCTRCSNRNVHRAALTGNKALLDKCLWDKERVTNMNMNWGPDYTKTPFEILIEKKNPDLLELMMRPKLAGTSQTVTYDMKRNALFSTDRVDDDPYLINFINTGHVSHMAYGAHVRSVEMTRGNR